MTLRGACVLSSIVIVWSSTLAHGQSLVEGVGGPARDQAAPEASPADAEPPALQDLVRQIRVHWRDGVAWAPRVNDVQARAGAQAWTVDPRFEGPVLVFRARGQGTDAHRLHADQEGYVYYAMSWDADVTVGPTGVEGYDAYVRLLTIEQRRELIAKEGWHMVERGIDLGEVNVARDEALDLRRYADAAIRVYGTYGVRPNEDWGFFVDLSASAGVAHARSLADRADVTNAFGGWTTQLRLEHRRNRVYLFFENRKGIKNGDDLQTRKAKFALGYEHDVSPHGRIGRLVDQALGEDARLSVGVEGGKRSFRWQTEHEFNRLGPVHDTYETERFLGVSVRLRFR